MKDMAWTISANLHTAPTAPGLKYPELSLHTAVSCNYNKDPVTACDNHSLGGGECSGVGAGGREGGGGGRKRSWCFCLTVTIEEQQISIF